MSTYDHIRCPLCGRAWQEHSPDCPRHEFRPGAELAAPPGVSLSVRSPAQVIALPLEECGIVDFGALAERAARRLAVALASVSRPGAEVVVRVMPGRPGELEWATVHTAEPAAPLGKPVPDPSAEVARLRAAIERIEREAVILCSGSAPDGRETWEWAVGQVCSFTCCTRDEAVAAFRKRFGLDGD